MSEGKHRLELQLKGSSEDFSVRRFAVQEGLSELFSVSVLATAKSDDVPLSKIIGEPGGLMVTRDPEKSPRVWSGIVNHCEQLHAEVSRGEERRSTYYFHIVPALWKTTQRRNHRIFQRKTLPDIVKALLAEWKIEGDWQLLRPGDFYKPHDFVVQYGETDFDFINRLLEESGITFYYKFEGTKEPKLTLADKPHEGSYDTTDLPPGGIPCCDEPEGKTTRDMVMRVRVRHSVATGAVTLRDYELRRQYNTLWMAHNETKSGKPETMYENYHYAPGSFLVDVENGGSPATPIADDKAKPRHDKEEGNRQAELMLQALRKDKFRVRYETNIIHLAPGLLFQLTGHPRKDIDHKSLLATRAWLEGTPEGFWAISGEAAFTKDPKDKKGNDPLPWVPERKTPKPKILGMQSAVVVGPKSGDKNLEIHTDELGRVRVQFHWDREGKYDDNSSCWVRVNQDWAGAGWGTILLPRVGHEVLVGFYEGDPDLPVVVGRVYGEQNQVPYELPKHKTRSTWKSDSSPKGDGLNEIMFEDKDGEELFYLQAERDLQKLVKKYETERTKVDRMQIIGHDRQTIVGELDAHQIGERWLVQSMKKPSKEDLQIQEQKKPKIDPLKTTLDMVMQKIIFTTGKATIAFDRQDIRIEAQGTVTLKASGDDIIIEGKHTYINSQGPRAAPRPEPFNPLEPGTYQSHKADEQEDMTPKTSELTQVPVAPIVFKKLAKTLKKSVQAVAKATGGKPPEDTYFIALLVPPGEWSDGVAASLPPELEAENPNDLHMTVAYLGKMTEADAIQKFDAGAAAYSGPAPTVTLGKAAVFGETGKVMASQPTDGTQAVALMTAVQGAPGIPDQKYKPPTPHVSVAKKQPYAPSGAGGEWLKRQPPIEHEVKLDRLVLYKRGDAEPPAPAYTIVKEKKLP